VLVAVNPVCRYCGKQPIVQISVVVANTKERLLRTEVEKGSLGTVVVQGVVDPKLNGKSNTRKCLAFFLIGKDYIFVAKGKQVNIPVLFG